MQGASYFVSNRKDGAPSPILAKLLSSHLREEELFTSLNSYKSALPCSAAIIEP